MAQMLPGGEQYKLGCSSADQHGLKQALKKSAPLATGDWMIYIADSDGKIEYGVFKGESNPISVSIDSILLSKENNFRAVLRANLGKLDLTGRDEFDAQRKVLERTRARLEALEQRVAELEARAAQSGKS